MEKNVQILFLALGVIVVIALFSGNFTGKASSRGVHTCYDTDGGYRLMNPGTVVVNIGGQETWYEDGCRAKDRLKEYYCVGTDQRFREDWCPSGTTCLTRQDTGGDPPYGVTAYCG
ncbi:MAG: hypothetical protein ABIB47_03780 [Candidatus Woesearchaeota archaeon]